MRHPVIALEILALLLTLEAYLDLGSTVWAVGLDRWVELSWGSWGLCVLGLERDVRWLFHFFWAGKG